MRTTTTLPCSNILLHRTTDFIGSYYYGRELSFDRNESGFSLRKKLGFLHLIISTKFNPIHPLLASSSSSASSSSPEPQVDLDAAEIQNQEVSESKKVHIKFQLQKECAFGEQFFIVGDDPMFGLWDPECAIPLNWSDGHVWNVELDVPAGKSIQFKFILKGITGKVSWQPGPDRIVQTWETANTVVVWEDWENSEFQKIVEEEPFSSGNGESTVNTEMLIVAENLIHQNEESVSSLNKEMTIVGGSPKPLKKPSALSESKPLFVADNISYPKKDPARFKIDKDKSEKRISREVDKTVAPADESTAIVEEAGQSNNGRTPSVNSTSTDVMANLMAHEGGDPVLAPGLSSLSIVPSDQTATDDKDGRSVSFDASAEVDEVKNHDSCELDEKHDLPQEEAMKTCNDENPSDNELYQKAEAAKEGKQHKPQNEALHNHIQWGRKMLQKLLTNLGML